MVRFPGWEISVPCLSVNCYWHGSTLGLKTFLTLYMVGLYICSLQLPLTLVVPPKTLTPAPVTCHCSKPAIPPCQQDKRGGSNVTQEKLLFQRDTSLAAGEEGFSGRVVFGWFFSRGLSFSRDEGFTGGEGLNRDVNGA